MRRMIPALAAMLALSLTDLTRAPSLTSHYNGIPGDTRRPTGALKIRRASKKRRNKLKR